MSEAPRSCCSYTTSSYAIAGGSAMNEAAQPHFHSRLSPQSKGRETDSDRRQIRRSLFQRHFTLDSRGRAKRETLKKRLHNFQSSSVKDRPLAHPSVRLASCPRTEYVWKLHRPNDRGRDRRVGLFCEVYEEWMDAIHQTAYLGRWRNPPPSLARFSPPSCPSSSTSEFRMSN